MDPAATWAPADHRITVRSAPLPGLDDASRIFRAESARALDAVGRSAV